VKLVNTAQREAELAALRRSVQRGCPFGEALWSDQMVRRLGLEMTIRPHGRPRKQDNGS
jgi:putative transposase